MSEGRHVKVHGLADPERLGSPETISKFLVSLVERIGMRPLGEPTIYDVKLEIEKLGAFPFEDEGGVTGTVVLSTSHIAMHTWPLRNYFTMDVFSCRNFSTWKVQDHATEWLSADKIKIFDLSYALEYELPKP